ncbi:MAG: hypothetical protein HY841_05650 [Bacteroidetes bacterium]|nr:hypothetical protein [Bacteroidota bacterium]
MRIFLTAFKRKERGDTTRKGHRVFFAFSACILSAFSAVNVLAAETIAVSYFDNTSHIVSYDPLSKGISDMLITDLSKIQGVTIVERSRLEDILKEIELNKSKYFDEATAQKLGKGLGAKSILTGAYIFLNDVLRIDARMVDVQSGKIIMAESVNCNKDDFFTGYKQLVELITKQMKLSLPATSSLAPKNNNVGLNAVVQYSKALDFADKGLNDDASTLLASTVKQFPDFGFAKNKLDELKAWMKEMDKQHELRVAEETKKLIAGIDTKDPLLGQQIGKVWTMLLTSWSYTKILSFNNELRTKGIKDDFKLYGETVAITFGEMMLYYECLSHYSLKDNQKIIETGKQFMEKYPTSMYYSSIKMYMEQAVAELEKREKGKAVIDEELMKTELEVYVDFFDSYKFKNALELSSKKDYEFYKNIYTQRVLGFGDELLKGMIADNKFSIEELFTFRNAAERFEDVVTLDKIAAKSKIFGDEAIRVEEEIISNKKGIEKQKKFVTEAKQKFADKNEKEIEQLARDGRELDESMDFSFEESVMRLYLKQNETAKSTYYRYDAWKHLIISVLAQGKTEEAKAELKNFQNDKILYAQDSMRFKREFVSLKNDFNEKQKIMEEDKQNALQQLVYEKKVETYSDHNQYADEAATRLQLINNYNLPADKNELQLFKLVYAYYNIGYFDEARKTAKFLQDKYPKGSLAPSIESLMKYMPQ